MAYDPKIMKAITYGAVGLAVGYLGGLKYKGGTHAVKIAGAIGAIGFAVGYITTPSASSAPVTVSVTQKEQIQNT